MESKNKEQPKDDNNKKKIQDEERSKSLKDEGASKESENEEKYIKLKAKEVEELKNKSSEYNALRDKYLRTCADFDNARKRWDKEKQGVAKFANFSLIKELLVILDELEHALKAVDEHSQVDKAPLLKETGESIPLDKIAKGVELTYNNLRSILEKEGVKAIEAKGKKFDPHIHEIVGQVNNPDVEEHTVLEEIQRGYFLGDSLLRTSKVIISVREEHKKDKGNIQKTGGENEAKEKADEGEERIKETNS